MNFRPLVLISACLTATIAWAADQNYIPMKILQTDPATFPREVTALGLTTGEAHVSIQIDEAGKLTDLLVTGYSHPKFAEHAVIALKRWKYEPAMLNGKPHSATVDLAFNFETKGMVVVDMTVSSYVELRNLQLRPGAYGYAACRLSQLDRIPTPTKVVQPGYPVDSSNQRRAAVVTVYFYIDEQGRVRLPAVSPDEGETNNSFAAAAIDAVSQWQFEPPLSHGTPVLVAARQEFKFRPTAAAAK
jgi:TonB family protein